MKKHLILLSACSIISLTACNSTKNMSSQSDAENKAETSMTQASEQAQETETTMNEETEDSSEMSSNTNAMQMSNGSTGGNANVNMGTSTVANSTADYSDLYQNINMTDGQIRDFESAMGDFVKKQKTSANGEMMGTLEDERDRQLENILSDEQYSTYETWRDKQ
ncbi:hypothetical protein [Pseudozobellia sp. WGM2]|uniref:hypothetical protein n=1 Tax=Pseudozobellia sp. WGM2 TaxID=2787625 RepID=UPI001ADF6014|nr:hypothetical protein [Pseudozobellia sp. WGM2]